MPIPELHRMQSSVSLANLKRDQIPCLKTCIHKPQISPMSQIDLVRKSMMSEGGGPHTM